MAAPTYVQKKQLFVAGGGVSPDAVTLASASTTGHLLVLGVLYKNGETVTTPTGWTRDVNGVTLATAPSAGVGRIGYVFHTTSVGETTVNVTVSNNGEERTYVLLEYAGLTNASLEAAAFIRHEDAPGPGFGKMPAITYGAGPRAVVGFMFMEGGPQSGDTLDSNAPTALRTPNASTDGYKRLGAADGLFDNAGDTIPLYPTAGYWVFTFTDTGALLGVGLVFEDAAVAPSGGGFIDWDLDGFNIGNDDDVSGNVTHWVISRGSGPEITGGSEPGTATLTLKNPDDIYNPRNASSPIYTKLRDGVPVWIGVNSDGKLTGADPRGLFGGRITDITLLPSGGASESPLVEFQCEDALGWYQRTPVKIDYDEGRQHDALRLAALVDGGETRYSLAHEIHTMPLSHADGDLRSVLDDINAVNGTRHFAKPADLYTDWYTYTTRNRQWRLDATVDASVDAGAEYVTDTSGWRLSADTVINEQKATVTPVEFTPGTFTVWESDVLPLGLTAAAPFSRFVEFDDVVRDPVLDLATSGSAVTSTFTPFATAAKIELSTAGTSTVNQLSVEGRLARRLPAESHVADDTTSQAAPRGIRAGSEIGNEYLGVLASASGVAEHVVWRYGDPQLRPTLTIHNWFPEQFDLDLYDVISFTSTQLDMTDRLFEIVGLTHEGDIAADDVQHHVVTYVLQECKVQADPGWFVLDTSELAAAGTDILAY